MAGLVYFSKEFICLKGGFHELLELLPEARILLQEELSPQLVFEELVDDLIGFVWENQASIVLSHCHSHHACPSRCTMKPEQRYRRYIIRNQAGELFGWDFEKGHSKPAWRFMVGITEQHASNFRQKCREPVINGGLGNALKYMGWIEQHTPTYPFALYADRLVSVSSAA